MGFLTDSPVWQHRFNSVYDLCCLGKVQQRKELYITGIFFSLSLQYRRYNYTGQHLIFVTEPKQKDLERSLDVFLS